MATLVFNALGSALGGPIGGALGAVMGRQVDNALLGSGARDGPRLHDLDVTLSSYGQPIPRIHGRMRIAGTVIWATELQEHSEVQGAKGQPGVTAYSYAANFAVALSSRKIRAVGRIWADGKLLRGSAGDMKVGGTLRIYRGSEDQPVDPLIAAAQGSTHCPAFRGLAYVVFEALELAEFGNRIPALTFEVIADDAVQIGALVGETVSHVRTAGRIEALAGLVVEDSTGATLSSLDAVLPVRLDAAADEIRVQVADEGLVPVPLDEAAAAVGDDAFSPAQGVSSRRAALEQERATVLRYRDVARDYQPATQHPTGRAGRGQPRVVELPAALAADQARALVEQMGVRRDQAREHISWRTIALDPLVLPGSFVELPDRPGIWRVESWEWREHGLELALARCERLAHPAMNPATGAFPAPTDAPAAATAVVAFEMPWHPAIESSAAASAKLMAAVGADSINWSGAALYIDHGDGQMWPLGPSGRTRAAIGTVETAPRVASPLLIDRESRIIVTLAGPDQALASATTRELAQGANLALVGDEILQFAKAEPLGNGRWRLSLLVRGCGGTEPSISSHAAGEPFALIDRRLVALGPSSSETGAGATVLAIGRGDPEPASSPLRLAGIAVRPLAPVHARAVRLAGGGMQLAWTRRARGAWTWQDGVDVPLVEEAERYLVSLEQNGSALSSWSVTAPTLTLCAGDLAPFAASAPAAKLCVRQQGTHALSPALFLASPFLVS